jgi:methylthioribose-1-phosphate isomerase
MKNDVETLYYKNGSLFLLNQLKLPSKVEYVECNTVELVRDGIKNMIVRGAPAIGVTAAYGMAIAANFYKKENKDDFIKKLSECSKMLFNSRPTAVNLRWALEKMKNIYDNSSLSPEKIALEIEQEAIKIHKEDIAINKKIGEYGASLIKDKDTILTHCNAGALATAGWGTALGVIRSAFEQKKDIRVFIDETRPYLQGARITAFEIKNLGIKSNLICDNMAGYFMSKGEINSIVVGADRIASNGDTANKIGTYSLAVLANHHKIPFYIAAPVSTIDFSIKDGSFIPIDERNEKEILEIKGIKIAPEGMSVKNPAFDVTPNNLITAIITEKGILTPPFSEKIANLK